MALGLVWNALWPKGVKIAFKRPVAMVKEGGEQVSLAEISIGTPAGEPGTPPAAFVGLRYLTLAELDSLRLLPGALLLDARPPTSFARAHIPGALNLPVEEVPERQEQLTQLCRAALLLVYCDDPRCDAAERLADELLARGCRAVGIYREGFRGWTAAGKAVARMPEGEGGGR